jgi:hypothetical protein
MRLETYSDDLQELSHAIDMAVRSDNIPESPDTLGVACNNALSGEPINVFIGKGGYGWWYGSKLVDGMLTYHAKHEIVKGDWVSLADVDAIPEKGANDEDI